MVLRAALTNEANVAAFGARGDGTTNDTAAFAAASAAIETMDGGYLKVLPGTYIVGAQTFTGPLGPGHLCYTPANVIKIQGCDKPVTIDLRGVRLVTAPGLKFGAFDPTTGEAYASTLPFTDGNYGANIGNIIDVRGNRSVTIIGPFELDGNIAAQTIGGQFGDIGWQTVHNGIVAYNNQYFAVRDGGESHHFGSDGVTIGWTDLTTADDVYPHIVEGLKCLNNSRLGLALVGCNHLVAESCDFSYTRLGSVFSNPGAGLDIEVESSIIQNVHLRTSRFYNNGAAGLLADWANAEDVTATECQFIAAVEVGGYALWPRIKRFRMRGGRVIGAVGALHAATSERDRSAFRDVLFSSLASDAPTGVIGWTSLGFDTGNLALYENCFFDVGAIPGPGFPTDEDELAVLTNCHIRGTNEGPGVISGRFFGHCTVQHSWASLDTTTVHNHGSLLINGVEFT